MERILVTAKELVDILNKELRKIEDAEGCIFNEGVTRLKDKDENGCNVSTVYIRGNGVEAIRNIAGRIIVEAKMKYNLK